MKDGRSPEDLAADRWAARRGARLAHPIDGGGNYAGDREPDEDLRRRIGTGLLERQEIDAFLSWLEAARDACRAPAAQFPELDLQCKVFRMVFVENRSELQVARAFGRKSHSWAAERIAEVRAVAVRFLQESGTIAVKCAFAPCRVIMTSFRVTGSPKRYHSRACSCADRMRRYRARREVTRAVTDMRETKCDERAVRILERAVQVLERRVGEGRTCRA